jgi:hypothetical protein
MEKTVLNFQSGTQEIRVSKQQIARCEIKKNDVVI